MPTSPQSKQTDLTQILDGIDRLESLFSGIDARLRVVEQCLSASQATQAGNHTASEKNIEGQLKTDTNIIGRIIVLEDFMRLAQPWIAALKWVTIALGGQIVAIVAGILTLLIKGS